MHTKGLSALSSHTWRHLDNLAARLGMTTETLLDRIGERTDLLDAIAAALAQPIVPDFSPYRLAPSHPITTQIAEITVSGETIWVRSDWNQILIDTVKGLGYRWDERNGVWYRQITKLMAPLADRLVELGVHLLAAGTIIQVPTQALADRIVAGDYQPERKRWVSVSNLDHYAGWFYVFWPYGEPYRDAVKRLTGARLFRSSAVVPGTSFDEVLDFADRHEFSVSDKALALAAIAERDRAAMLISDPAVRATHCRTHLSEQGRSLSQCVAPTGIPDELADDPL